MSKVAPPLVGYNTNVRHQGKVFHIQTEDSGRQMPHVITHLFADGGRIVSTKKTSYADRVEDPECAAYVRKLMQDQHKAMFIELRDGKYDAELGLPPSTEAKADDGGAPTDRRADSPTRPSKRPKKVAPVDAKGPKYKSMEPAASGSKPGSEVLSPAVVSEQSLDEVILSYLAEDDPA